MEDDVINPKPWSVGRMVRAWIHEYPELCWFLVLGLALYAGLEWARYYAPDAALDGFEAVVALFPGIIQGFAITVCAWLCKRAYTHDLDDEDERLLFAQTQYSSELARSALYALIVDRLEWAAWIGLWFALLR